LFAICIKIKDKYAKGGHGKTGKKIPINHSIKTAIESVIRSISILRSCND
jgi:hypothetical protein